MVLMVLSVVLGSIPSSAKAFVDTWPRFGEKIDITSGGDYNHPNLSFMTKDEKTQYHFYFNGSNGWKIYEIYMKFNPGFPV